MSWKKYLAFSLAGMMAVSSLMGCGSKEGGDQAGNSGTVNESGAGEDNLPVDESGNPSPFGKYKETVTLEIIQSINPSIPLPEGESMIFRIFL